MKVFDVTFITFEASEFYKFTACGPAFTVKSYPTAPMMYDNIYDISAIPTKIVLVNSLWKDTFKDVWVLNQYIDLW